MYVLQSDCAGFDLVVSGGACWIHDADTITDVAPSQTVNQYIRTKCDPASPTPSPGSPTREYYFRQRDLWQNILVVIVK